MVPLGTVKEIVSEGKGAGEEEKVETYSPHGQPLHTSWPHAPLTHTQVNKAVKRMRLIVIFLPPRWFESRDAASQSHALKPSTDEDLGLWPAAAASLQRRFSSGSARNAASRRGTQNVSSR